MFRSFRVHQCRSDQMQILKDRSTHTAKAVGTAVLNQQSVQLNKVTEHYIIYIYIYIYISVILGYIGIIHIYYILYIH